MRFFGSFKSFSDLVYYKWYKITFQIIDTLKIEYKAHGYKVLLVQLFLPSLSNLKKVLKRH